MVNHTSSLDHKLVFNLSPHFPSLTDTRGLINACNDRIACILAVCLENGQAKQMTFLLESIQVLLIQMFEQEEISHVASEDNVENFSFSHRGLLLRLCHLLSQVHCFFADNGLLSWSKKDRLDDLIQEIEVFNVLISCSYLLKQRQMNATDDFSTTNRWMNFGVMDDHDWDLLSSINPSVFLKHMEDTPFGKQVKSYLASLVCTTAAYSKIAGIPVAKKEDVARLEKVNIEPEFNMDMVQSLKGKLLSFYYKRISHESASLRADEIFKTMSLDVANRYRELAYSASISKPAALFRTPRAYVQSLEITAADLPVNKPQFCEYCSTMVLEDERPSPESSIIEETTECSDSEEIISLIDPIKQKGLDGSGNTTLGSCTDLYHKHFHLNEHPIHSPINIRLISSTKLKVLNSTRPMFTRSAPRNIIGGDCIIIHISQCGFCTDQSRETYLKQWANQTGALIFSVEMSKDTYGSDFASQIERAYLAYRWIIANAEQFLATSLRKVVLHSDSIGSATAIAVMMRCIFEKFRLPDSCFFSYPWVYIPLEMSCSRWNSLLPSIAELNYMRRCSEMYLGKSNSSSKLHSDPWISPAIAPDEILSHLPFTFISIASLDPLMDDGLYLARRISKNNGGRAKVEVFDGLDHGFLQLSSQKQSRKIGDVILYHLSGSTPTSSPHQQAASSGA